MRVDGFPLWNAHGVQSFWFGLFPQHILLVQLLYFICAVGGVFIFFRIYKSTSNPSLWFGAAICLTVWITPYIMIYDWVLLIIPAILFWLECKKDRGKLKVIYGFVWVVMFFSSVLSFGLWSYFNHTVQLSIPAILIANYYLYLILRDQQSKLNLYPSE